MKKNLIYLSLMLGAMSGATWLSSCEDMLDPESDLVMTTDENRLSTVNDTLYSVMGIVHLMQQVADRTNLLGEVRGDLSVVTEDATTALREIAEFTADAENSYNRPQDYYAIVNNCNYFLATADTSLMLRGRKVFEREYAAVKTFRAWAYLQLALNYGSVPFYTQFIGTKEEGDAVMQQPKRDLAYICNYLIDDLRPYVDVLSLSYGSVGNFSSSAKFFIPVRVMLGDLCLWAGRYSEAAEFYHSYLNDTDNPRPITTSHTVYWVADLPATRIVDGYAATNISNSEVLTYIPMESSAFEGTVSKLQELYCSTTDNDYYFQVTKSQALVDLSYEQDYEYVYTENNHRDTICLRDSSWVEKYRHGDLRLYANLVERNEHNSSSSTISENYQSIDKHNTPTRVILYRLAQVYLRYAEALNRAGYPSAAFAILKYGLCSDNIERYVDARDRANAGDLISFNQYSFTRNNVIGIHARGCGDVDANKDYVLPQPADSLATYADTVQYQIPLVEEMILTESALENAFEGVRFYDLMRIALRRGDPDFLARHIAQRNGTGVEDAALRARLQNTTNWYLPLPE